MDHVDLAAQVDAHTHDCSHGRIHALGITSTGEHAQAAARILILGNGPALHALGDRNAFRAWHGARRHGTFRENLVGIIWSLTHFLFLDCVCVWIFFSGLWNKKSKTKLNKKAKKPVKFFFFILTFSLNKRHWVMCLFFAPFFFLAF